MLLFSGAPDSLLGVEGREHYRFVVNCGGVLIDGGGGLGAEVAVAGIEVEGADVVGAAGAGEFHAALDASDGVVSLHNSSVVVWQESGVHVGGAAKVIRARWLGFFNLVNELESVPARALQQYTARLAALR